MGSHGGGSVEQTVRHATATGDHDLMVIVPPNLLARAHSLNEALTGTRIRVVVDRRQGERRCSYEEAASERRLSDRRAETRILGYVLACPVVTTAPHSRPRPGVSLPESGPPSLRIVN
jgi:hypothetical protein